MQHAVGIVGYGEVGRIFAEDLRAQGIDVFAYDSRHDAQVMHDHAQRNGVTFTLDDASVAAAASLIFSCVTASQTEAVANSLRQSLRPGTIVVDVNSASPGAKLAAFTSIAAASGRYVEAAVMTSVPPYRTKVPMLLGGPHAEAGRDALIRLGFAPAVASPELGIAAATKMVRSVMIKGLEAMVIESFSAARHYGVEDELISSLHETFPSIDWDEQATYFFHRVIQHGRRRAEEMHEAARTVHEAGLQPMSATATAHRQAWTADLTDDGQFTTSEAVSNWRQHADRLLCAQPMSAGWLEPHPAPSVPTFILPPGAVDAHCHVFGPTRQFPFAPQRKYTPGDAGRDQLFALRDRLGFAKSVIVQATCHGTDNRALVDALNHSAGRARGVVSLDERVTDAELEKLHLAGVRGVRFNFVKRLVDFTPTDVLARIANRIAAFDWHVVVYFEATDLAELAPFFAALPTKVVVDHMGRPDVSQPVDGPAFGAFVQFMHDNPNVWSKVTCPERLSISGPPAVNGEPRPYRDVVPFCRTLVESFPDRVLWGTDWPHPNLTNHMPDDGLLVNLIPEIAPTADLQYQLLVTNPNRLYWNNE
jgi:2-pyrone-4,6-dicarboxylate lactonase